MNISVEFEDEKDPSRNGSVIKLNETIPEGFFQKKFFFFHNTYKSSQFLTLIRNLILVFKQIVPF